MKPAHADLKRTVATISAMKFFPAGDAGVRDEIMDLLVLMVDTAENLEWLRCTLRDRVREWPGLAELRAIYCTSKRPADGNEGDGYSIVPGFRPGDIEREHIEAPRDQYARLGPSVVRQIAAAMEPLDRIDSMVAEVQRFTPEPAKPAQSVSPADDEDTIERRRRIAEDFNVLDRQRTAKVLGQIDGI